MKSIFPKSFVAVCITAMLIMIVTACGSSADSSSSPSKYMISGTVSGDFKIDVTLTLTDGTNTLTALTDSAGAYTLTDVTDGTYMLTPSLNGYTFSPASSSVTVGGANETGKDFICTISTSVSTDSAINTAKNAVIYVNGTSAEVHEQAATLVKAAGYKISSNNINGLSIYSNTILNEFNPAVELWRKRDSYSGCQCDDRWKYRLLLHKR